MENLTFSYSSSGDLIFENVNFQIDTDWKLGFVGRNGRGKTTFLNLLQGKFPYKGNISSSVQFDYFPYAVPVQNELTGEILREVCPIAEEWEFMREFSYLEVSPEALYRPFCTLSNGERTKVLLAALFLNEGHFLLIDEPTNHLDVQAREIVAAYLKKKKSFILVSHDRKFLDGCVDHILSLNKTDIEVQKGNFSSFMTNFESRQESERRQSEHLQNDIKRLQESARQTAEWADKVEATKYGVRNSGLRPDRGFIGHKAAKMMKRAKCTEAARQREIEQKSTLLKNTETAEKLKLSPLTYFKQTLLSVTDAAVCYGGKAVCAPVSFSLNCGDRIALEGKNGSGKSSFLKLFCGGNIEHTGLISLGSNLKISYVPQDTSAMSGTLSAYASESGIDKSLFMAILSKMGFDSRQFEKDISEFSEGQKKKTALAKSLCENAHLYVWDEPFNYIDVYSRMQIENLLKEYAPTMIFVEHDRAFRENIATSVVSLVKP